jgi:hypothetical protein
MYGSPNFTQTKIFVYLCGFNSFLAYYMIYTFSQQMSRFVFTADQLEEFVASHSIIVREIDTSISKWQAAIRVRKEFQDDVIACITYSGTRKVSKLRMKVRQL